MKRKPKTAPKQEAEKNVDGNLEVPIPESGALEGLPDPAIPAGAPEGMPHAEGGILDPLLVTRLALLQERIVRLNAQNTGYNLLFEAKRKELEEARNTTMTQIKRDLVIAEGEYREIQRQIEKKHQINLKDFTFDADTGRLNRVVEVKPEESS
jgi:hypothetical protein